MPQKPEEDVEDENIIITDDENMVSPNPAEDEEETQGNIGDNGTIMPDEEPSLPDDDQQSDTSTETQLPEKDPSYDMPNDPIHGENTSNKDKGENTDEDFWFMN